MAESLDNELGELHELLVRIGIAMTVAGEPVDATQDRLYRIGEARGLKNLEIAVLPTTLLVQVGAGSDARVQLGVRGGHIVPRLDQVGDIYLLAAELERNERSASEGLARLDQILVAEPPRGRLIRIVGYGVLCVGFALFLQPAWGGLLVAFVLGVAVGTLTTWRFVALQTLMPVLASFLVGVAVFGTAKYFEAENPIRALIPPLVAFLPGAVLATGTVELAAGQVISGSARLVQGLVGLALMAFGIVAAAELVGAPQAHLLDVPFNRLGPWAPWIGLGILTLGHYLHSCAPRRTLLPILAVLVVAYGGQLIGAAVFGADVSAFFGALAMTPIVLWISERSWGPPSMVTFLPAFWLLVPGAAGLIGVTEIVGTDSPLGRDDFAKAIGTVLMIGLGILIGTAIFNSTRAGVRGVATFRGPAKREVL
ncbi:MAG TPA: threonine/serine exporter family protein [Ilumatobacteraceae bacterium]|nr:threonine/serine exporter family protein [Ilumatobacteraceae bacterium]